MFLAELWHLSCIIRIWLKILTYSAYCITSVTFYPRDAVHSAVFATVMCPPGHLLVDSIRIDWGNKQVLYILTYNFSVNSAQNFSHSAVRNQDEFQVFFTYCHIFFVRCSMCSLKIVCKYVKNLFVASVSWEVCSLWFSINFRYYSAVQIFKTIVMLMYVYSYKACALYWMLWVCVLLLFQDAGFWCIMGKWQRTPKMGQFLTLSAVNTLIIFTGHSFQRVSHWHCALYQFTYLLTYFIYLFIVTYINIVIIVQLGKQRWIRLILKHESSVLLMPIRVAR